jgi:hypothetical protein
MNDLVPGFEPETGQVILEGLPAGAAGEAALMPAPGVDLAFDRADGRLCRVVVDTNNESGRVAVGEQPAAMLARLFHRDVLAAATGSGRGRALSPDPALCLELSRLARLDAARVTSPVTRSSPWWAAEAADLAERADLSARAAAEARRAVSGLAEIVAHQALPDQAYRTAAAVAGLAAADDPDAAGQLRDSLAARPGSPRAPGGLDLDAAAEVEGLKKDQGGLPGLHWNLDPGLVPEGLFRPGLSPHSDLFVCTERGKDRVVVEAVRAPGAGSPDAACAALERCRVRLVDPEVRRVLAQASFSPARCEAAGQAGVRVRAELVLPFPPDDLHETWVEVVEGERRPVRSARGHRTRRALRWADAALRAERRPAGLAPRSTEGDWTALAAAAWERCQQDWECAGDADRAFLAVRRLADLDSGTCLPAAPSTTADTLARQPPFAGPAYLAEVIGD